jgi:hypothetical protein
MTDATEHRAATVFLLFDENDSYAGTFLGAYATRESAETRLAEEVLRQHRPYASARSEDYSIREEPIQ